MDAMMMRGVVLLLVRWMEEGGWGINGGWVRGWGRGWRGFRRACARRGGWWSECGIVVCRDEGFGS